MPPRPKPMSDELLALIAARFQVLSEAMRLKILRALMNGELSVTELVEATGSGQANVSKHLRLLLEAGLVARRREGLHAYYTIADDSVFRLCDAVCETLAERLSAQHRTVRSFRRR